MAGRGRGKPSPRKTSRRILEEEIRQGMAEYERPAFGLWLSSVAAGLEIGFSVLLMGVMLTIGQGQFPSAVTDLLVANMYAVGFVLVILGRSELFTEHTTLAVLPVLAGEFSVVSLLRVWVTVFVGNLMGCALFSALLVVIAPARHVVDTWAFDEIARSLLGAPWWVVLLSGVLAGWLMGELGWVVAAARDTISQVVCVWLITTAIGFAQLHHCIVGSVEVLAGVLSSGRLTLGDYGFFLLWTTVGNILGGVIFVALIKYGHASRAAEKGSPGG